MLYNELGWESLDSRRWCRRLTLFYKITNNLTPNYTRDPIPPLHQSEYSLRNQDVIGQLRPRTERFKSSFYPFCLTEWNKLDHLIKASSTVSIFKAKLLVLIRPNAKSVYGIHDPVGLSYLTQLRVSLSKLNLHKFKHNFRDAIDAMCPSNDGIESEEHFLLLCPSFDTQRRSLLDRTVLLIPQMSFYRRFCCMDVRIYLLILIGRYYREPFLSYEKQVALIEIITTQRRISPKIVGSFSTMLALS